MHTDALDASMTDWSQVVALYDQLLVLSPSPIVALNRAVAVAEVDGPDVALSLVEPLALGVVPRLARDPGRPAPPAADVTTRRGRPTTGPSSSPATTRRGRS